MNKLNKAMVIGASVATIGGVGIGTTTLATNGGSSWSGWWGSHVSESDNKFDTELSVELSTKYNLDEAEVAAVIEQVRDDQFNVLNEKRQERLQNALDNEKLTQTQYDHIVEKLMGVDALYDQVDDVDGSERKELLWEIKGEFKDLKEWMEDEDLSWRILGFYGWHGNYHHSR